MANPFIKKYFSELHAALDTIDTGLVGSLLRNMVNAWLAGRTVYVFGNGGSAATASHFACDLSKLTVVEGTRRYKVLALTDNVPIMTAWANDTSYANVFVQQLIPFVEEGDVVLGISGSGNSQNVIEGMKYARSAGAVTACLTGYQGGKVRDIVDIPIITYSTNMQLIEDSHSVLCHAMSLQLLAIAKHYSETGQIAFDTEIDLSV
jgi:D-sedoheptulose 7-phosphate isomerase